MVIVFFVLLYINKISEKKIGIVGSAGFYYSQADLQLQPWK